MFSVPSSIRKEGAGFFLWDTGAQRGWEALSWRRTAWAGGQLTIHSALGWDGWMASPTQWTWVWANSGRWWRTGKPAVLQSDGSESDTTEGLNTPHTHHYHPDREHKHSSQLVTTCGYLRCAGCGTWIKCIVLLVSAYSVQKVQIFHSNSAKVLRLSRSNTEKILYCFLTKASEGAHFSTSIWMGNGPCPRQKFCQIFFWNNPSLKVPETCFATRQLNDSFQEWSQIIKHLKPCLRRRLDGTHHFLSCLSRSYHPTQSYRRMTHTWTLLLPSIQTPPQSRPHRKLAASLDEWKCLLQTLWNWWSLSFLQIKVSTSSVYY